MITIRSRFGSSRLSLICGLKFLCVKLPVSLHSTVEAWLGRINGLLCHRRTRQLYALAASTRATSWRGPTRTTTSPRTSFATRLRSSLVRRTDGRSFGIYGLRRRTSMRLDWAESPLCQTMIFMSGQSSVRGLRGRQPRFSAVRRSISCRRPASDPRSSGLIAASVN